MGALKSRASKGFGDELDEITNSRSNNSMMGGQNIPETAYQIWQRSEKKSQDLINYIKSQQCRSDNYQKVLVFISSVTNRQKLYDYLNEVQKFLLGIKRLRNYGQNKENINEKSIQSKIDQKSRSILLNYIHPKLSNIWFIWNQLNSSHLTAAMIHERMLPQFLNIGNYGLKLQALYSVSSIAPVLIMGSNNNSFIDSSTIIKQAVRTNYPFLINSQSLDTFFEHLIETEVFIEDIPHFCKFLEAILQQLGTIQGIAQCNDYVQRLFLTKGSQDTNYEHVRSYLQKIHKQNWQNKNIYRDLLESGKKFLYIGYPHAMQLIYQTMLSIKKQQLMQSQSQVRQYLYTKIYSIFTYSHNSLLLQYKDLQKMSISNIIHLMLRNNNVEILCQLDEVYKKINAIFEQKKILQEDHVMYCFQDQLVSYIFSNYSGLLVCLDIVLGPTHLVTISSQYQDRQYRLLAKLNQSKFQVIIENQSLIRNAMEGCLFGNVIFQELCSKIQEVLQITRLLYMFGVNQKFGTLTIFYCPEIQSYFNKQIGMRNSRLEYIEQQRALQLFKTFVSKYLISGEKSKKIQLNSKSQSPISIDLSKPESILQISQYLYQKLFTKALNSIKDIHQIIFQHMIYFYRYDDARIILTNSNIINKYSLNTQMLEVIVINNIIETIRKASEIKKVINDVNQQLKMIKNKDSVQVQSVKALVRLVNQLSEHGIQLTSKQKDKIGVDLLYTIIENYSDRIDVLNFDEIYEEIRVINANEIIDPDQKFMMTNQLLHFKSKLAAKAYKVGKKNLGNELIDQISRFNPPWLTTELIEIFKNSNTKIDKRIYGVALKSCSKGQDLQYLMKLWKEQEGKQRRKQKGFADLTQYFETGREYLVINDLLIKNEQKFRNYVAQCQFNDSILHLKKYELFFVLIGSEPGRAFHYSLNVGLDPVKIEIFLRQAMKANIINSFDCINYLHKYYYFVLKIAQDKLGSSELPSYVQYLKINFQNEQLNKKMGSLQKKKDKSAIQQLYCRILSAFICSFSINERFINTYFTDDEGQAKNSIIYELLFDQKSRKSLLIGLREEPMGRSDIIILDRVCLEVLKINLVELCIFSLANLANTSEQLGQKAQNIMHKVITLSNNRQECYQIVSKLLQKVFSIKRLIEILRYLQSRENPIYKEILRERNLKVIQCLSMVEQNQELHGIIAHNFFQKQITYDPINSLNSLSESHYKAVKRCWTKSNIVVLSKYMSFIYGMNAEIQKKIWQDYLSEHPDDQLRQIKLKLQNV